MTIVRTSAPFLSEVSFVRDEPPPVASEEVRWSTASPFVSAYELEGHESTEDDPAREAYAELVNELYDEEFEQALFELSTHAREVHRGHLEAGHPLADAEQLVSQHFSRMAAECEAAISGMEQTLLERQGSVGLDAEIDSYVERHSGTNAVEPVFEQFFGKVLKKIGTAVKKAAGTAWQGIKKIGWAAIFGKLVALIRPLMNFVLQKAIGKLPAHVQPAARALAKRLGFASVGAPAPAAAAPNASALDASAADAMATDAPSAAAAGEPAGATDAAAAAVQDMVGGPPEAIQKELDQQIAATLLARDEVGVQLETAALRGRPKAADPIFAELDDARERFIRELSELRPGESAEPHIQNFLPALLQVVRLGFQLGGRPPVVNFLSSKLAKLIAKLIGEAHAPALSRAIVDAGLRLMNLETVEPSRPELAAATVAATVEEAVTRITALPEHVLDDPELLEAFALEAFESAAAANLPAVLSEATYRRRPELLEGGISAAWVPRPTRRPRYKRCSRRFKLRIPHHLAEQVESFDGVSLADHFHEQLGLPEGAEVEAELSLYEAYPGTSIADIAQDEDDAAELGGAERGAADEAAMDQLHPLTPHAASLLIGRPGLGRALPPASSRHHLFAGQRLYRLTVPGHRPLLGNAAHGRRRTRQPGRLDVTLDVVRDEIRVSLFLSEARAQRFVVRLREGAHAGALTARFRERVAGHLGRVLEGRHPRRLRIVHPGAHPGSVPETMISRLPPPVRRAFTTKLVEWLVHSFKGFAKTGTAQFSAAANAPSDGVTLRFRIQQPPGFRQLAQVLVDKGLPVGGVLRALASGSPANVQVEVFPGRQHG